MALFCLGNILLKVKRQTLPRPTTAPWLYVAVALLGVVAGLIGNTFMRQSAGFFHQEGNGRIAHDAELTLTGPEGHLTFYVDEGERFSNVAQQVNQSKDKTGVTAKATQTTLVFSTMEVGSDAIIQIEVVSGQFTINDSHHRKVTNSGSDGISNLITFFWYFIPAILIVSAMLGRIALLKFCLFVLRNMISGLLNPLYTITQWIRDTIERINSQQIVFFTRGDNIANLNNAMLYVKNNEHTNRIKLVTVVKDKKEVPDKLKEDINFLNEVYPSIEIEFVILEDNFGPALIDTLSKEWNIPKNFMFIGSPAGRMMYGLAELGGVRLIV